MAARLGMKLGKWLWKNDFIEENQIDEIRYAFEIICSEFLEILVMVFYGIFTYQIVSTALYLILFRILRDIFQGYHANTIWKCFTLTISAYLICMYSYMRITELMILVSLISSYLLQLSYCKVQKDMKPMFISILFMGIGAIIYTLGFPNFLHMLAVVDLLVSISLLPERRIYEETMHSYRIEDFIED